MSRLACIPVVALPLLAGACVSESDDVAYYRLQQQMGWNAEQQQILKAQMAALNLVLREFGYDDRTGRSVIAGLLNVLSHHHH